MENVNELVRSSWMVVRLETRGWGGSKTDKNVSREVEQQHGATEGSVRAVKQLMVTAKAEIEAVKQEQRAMRNYLDRVSIPWTGRGVRLVPTSQALDVLGELGRRRTAMRESVRRLAAIWDDRVQTSIEALGSLADPTKYPSAEDVPSLFDTQVRCEPLPSGADYSRLTLPADAAEALAERMERDQAEAINEVKQETVKRLQGLVDRIRERVQKKLDGERTRIHKSVLDELGVVAKLVRELDTDGSLQPLLVEIEQVSQMPAKALKEQEQAQRDVKVKFDNISGQLESMYYDTSA